MKFKILVTGGTGLVGKAIDNIKSNYNYKFIFIGSKDCNLTNLVETKELFENIKPDFVIHLAAYVGGLFKNMNNKVEMYEKNILINHNVLKCSHDYKVKKVISCLSTCIFPDNIK
jgi:GDP-L-fucose synthase